MLAHGSGCVFRHPSATGIHVIQNVADVQSYKHTPVYSVSLLCSCAGKPNYKHDVIAGTTQTRGIQICSDSCSSDVSRKTSPRDWLIQPPRLMPKVVVSRAKY